MKAKKLFLLLGIAALATVGCKKSDETIRGLQTANFNAEASAVTDSTATITVTVTGNDDAAWYGFLTTDTETNAAELAASYIGSQNINRHKLRGEKNVQIPLSGLTAGQHYRYIVSGTLADGTTYGTPGVADFVATGDFIYDELTRDDKIGITYVETTDDATYLKFTNAPSKFYFVSVTTKEFEGTYDSNASLLAQMEIANVQAAMASGASASDYYYAGDGTYTTDKFIDYTEYTVIAFGVTENFNATGTYSQAEFVNEPSEAVAATYEDWTGYWEIDLANDVKDTILIQKDEAGTGYIMTGFGGTSYELATEYDSSTCEYVVNTLSSVAQFAYNGSTYDVSLIAYIDYNGSTPVVTGNYEICRGTLYADGTAKLNPGSVTLNGGSSYDIVGMNIFATPGSGYYTFEENCDLPTFMRKIGDAPVFVATYEDWLGMFAVPRSSDEDATVDYWTIGEKENGSTYTITGIEGLEDEVEGVYNSTTGLLEIYSQACGDEWASSYGTAQDYLYATIEVSGKTYYLSGEYLVATAELAEDLATAKLTAGGDYDGSDYTGMRFYALLLDGDYAGYTLSFNTEWTMFPTTLTRTEFDDAYLKYLGEWEVPTSKTTSTGEYATFNVQVDKPNESYVITGWPAASDIIPAEYDADNYCMNIKGGLNNLTRTGIKYKSDTTQTYVSCLAGYYSYSLSKAGLFYGSDYTVCQVVMSGNKKAEFRGGTAITDLDGDGTNEVITFTRAWSIAIGTSDFTVKNRGTLDSFPFTAYKVDESGTSIKATSVRSNTIAEDAPTVGKVDKVYEVYEYFSPVKKEGLKYNPFVGKTGSVR